jgi:TolA-binding protein
VVFVLLLCLSATPLDAGVKEDLEVAKGLYRSGSQAAAQEAFRKIIDRHGHEQSTREAYYYLALLTRDGEDYIRYLEAFLDRGGRKDRRAAEVHLRLGRYYYSIGDYRNALGLFESARNASSPQASREARYWMGLTLMALREPDEAKLNLEQAAEPGGEAGLREAALFALGELHRGLGNTGASARAYRACAEASSAGDYAPACLLGEATARELQGEFAAVREILRRLVFRYPSSPEAGQARRRLKALSSGGGESETDRRTESSAGKRDAAETSKFILQVGAFASEENALKLADELLRRGFPAARVEKSDPDDGLFHVRLGGYASREEARAAGEKVSAALGLRYQIVPPREDDRR